VSKIDWCHESRLAERAAGGLGGDLTGQCIPHGMRNVRVGKDSFFVSADGYPMPTKKDQSPPDLRYFNR
jgi:hypothetical protein